MAAKVTLDACSHANPIFHPMYVDIIVLRNMLNHYEK